MKAMPPLHANKEHYADIGKTIQIPDDMQTEK